MKGGSEERVRKVKGEEEGGERREGKAKREGEERRVERKIYGLTKSRRMCSKGSPDID